MVNEAKAFCPGCGHAFVEEEKRQSASSFDKMDNTVQLGNTMYNQMLSDMGLNISKSPDKPTSPVVPKAEVRRIEVIIPPAAPAQVVKPPETKSAKAPSGNTKWYILGGVLIVLIVALLLVIAVLVYLIYSGRIGN